MRDVAFDIERIRFDINSGKYKFHVYWWNIGPHDPFFIGEDQELDLTRQQIADIIPYIYYGRNRK